eukprot:13333950-Alexandrium_andersonii.AAC.1
MGSTGPWQMVWVDAMAIIYRSCPRFLHPSAVAPLRSAIPAFMIGAVSRGDVAQLANREHLQPANGRDQSCP